MGWSQQTGELGQVIGYRNNETGEKISPKEYERRQSMQGSVQPAVGSYGTMQQMPAQYGQAVAPGYPATPQGAGMYAQPVAPGFAAPVGNVAPDAAKVWIQPNAHVFQGGQPVPVQGMPAQQMPAQGMAPQGMAPQMPLAQPGMIPPGQGFMPGHADRLMPHQPSMAQGKNLRMEGIATHQTGSSMGRKGKGFLDATSIAILMPTLVLLALIIAAAHKKRLFPWQTIRTFNPPSGLMTPREYERSFVCPPNGRKHGRLGKKNPASTWSEADGVVIPFGFLARTHLPVTIPMGRLPNKNMFLVAPSGSGKTTLMRAVIKALLAKPCVIIALEAKANDPNLDEKREGFKYSVLPEAQQAGFRTLYFNPLDSESIHWNPLDLDPNTFASSIVQDINSLPPEEQHWAERDMGYIEGLVQLLKWGAVQVNGEDENGQPSELTPLPCNPFGLMKLVNNRRNIVESMRRLKNDPSIEAGELGELTQRLSSIIRTDSDWDKNIQGVRGRLRMFKNASILRVTHQSNVDIKGCMHEPTVLIFGTPASLGPDAESLAACFVYQLQQALHTRYGTKSVLPLFAFFDEYQTLNIDLAGRLSAIVRGANGGLTVILQNISQIEGADKSGVSSELRTIFSNSAVRVCLHNADETTAKFFSDEIGKHAVVVPGIADHFQANGFGIFPTGWNRIHSQQVVARVDTDSIKRMEKHHALVYLSPAGDPEFGEVKPFMCDLRGIEEIARLHLLHNVNARRQASEDEGAEGDVPFDAPGGGGGGGMSMPGFAHGSSLPEAAATLAQDMANFGTPVYGEPAAVDPLYGQPSAPVAPAFAQNPYVASGPVPGVAPVAAAAPVAQPQVAQSSDPGQRICPSCGKGAGKGKFCIECGQFIGAAQAAQVELQTSARVVSDAPVQPFGAGIIPSYEQVQSTQPQAPAASAAPIGSLSATGQPSATPRYGGLQPQSRDAMPSKRGLFENASQIAETAHQVLNGGVDPANAQRRPITSLNPDTQPIGTEIKRKPGVEF